MTVRNMQINYKGSMQNNTMWHFRIDKLVFLHELTNYS